MVKNVLVIESGAIGGGSVNSLYNHIKALESTGKYRFFILFLSKSTLSENLSNLATKVFYHENTILNTRYAKKHFILSTMHKVMYKFLNELLPKYLHLYELFFHREIIKKIKVLIKEYDIDLIHTNNQPNRDIYAIHSAVESNLPIISHIRTSNTYGFTEEKVAFCNKHVKQFIPYTNTTNEIWSNVGIDKEKITVIENSLEETIVDEKKYLTKYQDKKLILLVGRIKPSRGYEFFLNVIAQMEKETQDFNVVIVGDYFGYESYYKKLVSIINKLHLNDRVHFFGYSNNIMNLIKEADLLVLPYKVEAFGRVVLEAWQLKTAVALSDNGDIRSYIKDRENGLLFQYGDIEGCKEVILDALSNSALREELTKNGYDTYNSKYTLDTYRNNILKVYDEVLAR